MSKAFYVISIGFIAVIVAIFVMGWAIRGEITKNPPRFSSCVV